MVHGGDPQRGTLMERVGTRSASLGVQATGRGLPWIGRPSPRRRDVGHGLAVAAMAVAVYLGYVAIPRTPITVLQGPDSAVVGWVAPGSAGWIRGIRPGLPVQVWPDLGGFSPLAGPLVEVPYTQVGPGSLALLVTIVMAVVGIFWARFGLPGGGLLVTIAVATAFRPVYPLLGLPDAYGLVPVPGIVGLVLADVGDRRTQRVFDGIAASALGSLLVVFALLATMPAGPWGVWWMLPGSTAVAIVSAAGVVAFWKARRSGARDGPAMAVEMVPIARRSWVRGASEERDRLAVDLHNQVLPRLDGSIRTLEDGTLPPSEAAAELRRVAEDLRGLMQDRQLVVLEAAGLLAALEGHLHELARHGIVVALDVVEHDGDSRPPTHVEEAAYRIAQEAVWNSIRHADPSAITIRVVDTAGRVVIEVEDDGAGFEPGGSQLPGHVGLTAMRTHARAVGGGLEISHRDPRGTIVRFEWTA